jgi:hypothetical protein
MKNFTAKSELEEKTLSPSPKFYAGTPGMFLKIKPGRNIQPAGI